MTRITHIFSDDRVSGASSAWFLAARLCLAAVFLYSGAAKLLFWSVGIEEFATLGLPMSALEYLAIVGALVVAIAAAGPGPFSLQPREHSS